MKKIITFIILSSVCNILFPQDQNSNTPFQRDSRLGLYFNLGRCQPIHFEKSDVGYTGKESYSFEFNYLKSFSKHINIEIGFSYSTYKVRVEPISLPGRPEPHIESINTLSIPILYDIFSKKLFHFGFGTVIDFSLPHNSYSQSGFGFLLNFGKEFPIDRFTIDVSPNLGFHSLIPFKSENTSHVMSHVMIQYGIKIGINYNLK